MAFKHGMKVDLCMGYIIIVVSFYIIFFIHFIIPDDLDLDARSVYQSVGGNVYMPSNLYIFSPLEVVQLDSPHSVCLVLDGNV